MLYKGETFQIPCSQGGFSANPNIDMAEPTDMIHPSRNINLNEFGRRKRGGTAHISDTTYDAAISGNPQIMGVYQFRLRNTTEFLIVATKAGKVYRAHDTTIKASGMSTTTFYDFETFDNELYIVDGVSTPEKWDGSGNTSTLTDIPTDWGSDGPQWIVKHGRGVSERLWAGGLTAYPHKVYISVNGDGDDFSDDNVTTISIETGDGFGIVGAVEFGDRLLCFGKRKMYVIDDSSLDTAEWGYDAAQWEGGAANFRLVVKTPNDVIAMMEDGEIYSVTSAEQYGDYKAASLTRDSFIHNWIKEYCRLSYVDYFHAVYDPVLRAIKFFVVRSGQTAVDTALVYFIDRVPKEAWMIHDNQDNVSGYSASCSALVRVSAGNYQVYTGGYSGLLWRLEQANRNDNGEAYYGGFKTPNMAFGNARATKKYSSGRIIAQPKGNYDLVIDSWIDGEDQTQRTVSLIGTGGILPFTLGTDLLGGQELIDKEFDIRNIGKRIQFEIYNDTVDQDFFVSQILVDHQTLGARLS
jgi:hypothetical protein